MYSDRRWYGQKTTPDKTFQTKNSDKIPREQLRENLYRGLLSGYFILGLLKIGGSEMCDVLLGPRDVTKCDRGEVVKIGQKQHDVLYGRPQSHLDYMLTTVNVHY